jgi:hypothetical protein
MEPDDPISRLSNGVFCPPIARVGFSAIPWAVFAEAALSDPMAASGADPDHSITEERNITL